MEHSLRAAVRRRRRGRALRRRRHGQRRHAAGRVRARRAPARGGGGACLSTVTVYEVGPRDGLQNEPGFVPTADKIALIDLLSADRPHPHRGDELRLAEMGAADGRRHRGDGRHPPRPGVRYAALTPNLQGFEAARAAGADEVAIFASASEGFSRRNINCTIAESLARFAPVAEAARAAGLHLRGYVSCVVECPYDGPSPPRRSPRSPGRCSTLGCYEVSLGDTIGRGTPETVDRAARPPDGGDRPRAPRRPLPRHRRPRARQRRGRARPRAADLRQRHRRPRRLPLRPRRQGQRLDRAARADARRRRLGDRPRPRRARARRGLHGPPDRGGAEAREGRAMSRFETILVARRRRRHRDGHPEPPRQAPRDERAR